MVIKNIEFADLSTSVSSHQLADPEDEQKNQQETGEEEINEIANGDANNADVSKIPEQEASPNGENLLLLCFLLPYLPVFQCV